MALLADPVSVVTDGMMFQQRCDVRFGLQFGLRL